MYCPRLRRVAVFNESSDICWKKRLYLDHSKQLFNPPIMHLLFSFVVVAVLSASSLAKESSPKVQVYSRLPGEFGKDNVLICHVSGFHPPDISIDLLKNGQTMSDAKQTDLAFEQGWQFHLTKSVKFSPNEGDTFTCKVRHLKDEKVYTWEPDM